MSRLHYFDSSWRYTDWDTSMGEKLKKLNKAWIIKKHYWTDIEAS